ncbi:hypothetical protein BO78DRAFT_168490 [Aspergillus sclerotiicarbonarius CBS 121057]|uniref:Uncharacterized protein n=1 Tax=Aspergillus sclerotiicarbonarius (strain CBS 121057 / IBT 28362) TaxID=1448318 RepID=A0A319ETI5_ASPSB|nr:hypothetical protein BO78DRAFT_168490 [Aspergillus sclerotiicarbonarius CBS 121057]
MRGLGRDQLRDWDGGAPARVRGSKGRVAIYAVCPGAACCDGLSDPLIDGAGGGKLARREGASPRHGSSVIPKGGSVMSALMKRMMRWMRGAEARPINSHRYHACCVGSVVYPPPGSTTESLRTLPPVPMGAAWREYDVALRGIHGSVLQRIRSTVKGREVSSKLMWPAPSF